VNKPEIVFLDYSTLGSTELSPIKKLGKTSVYELCAKNEIVKKAENAQIIITNKVVLDEEILSRLPQLKLICVAATGVNNIDLEACKKLGIAVSNVKGYSTPSVVQTMFSSLLSYVSKTSFFDKYVKDGSYAKSLIFTCMQQEFFEVRGKTLGIIGFGEIGQSAARIARSFGIKVVYYSTSGQNNRRGYKRVELEQLLQTSDFISVNCALNDKTKNLLGANMISKIGNRSVLMNFARGGIVDEAAVRDALNGGKLAAYITDVFEKEPITSSSPLFGVKDKNKLVLTPHIAWASVEARDRLVKEIALNIKAFLDGKQKNRVA